MDIRLQNGNLIQGCKKVTSKNEIKSTDRLFYELGEYHKWVKDHFEGYRPSGIFKEILNPAKFASTDQFMDNADYINHHNFHIKEITE